MANLNGHGPERESRPAATGRLSKWKSQRFGSDYTKITPASQSRGRITVEQLNRSQWHAYVPGGQSSGAGSYVAALNYGLLVASVEGRALQMLDRVGTYRTMMLAEG